MPITCETGFSNLWPPFWGNVKIKNFRLSKETVEAGESVRALGKAEIKKWSPWNDWGPYDGATVEIKWAWAGAPKKDVATGKTDGNGNFDIKFAGPYVTEPRTVNVWASLPEPKGGYPEKHLECGPLDLRTVPKGKKDKEGIPKYLYVAPAVGVGLGWLMSR